MLRLIKGDLYSYAHFLSKILFVFKIEFALKYA